ncbi:Hypothetical predicted protein [Cloeon dipterum]|uniref:Peptidase S1 domain-containing protein n=1 Tax=Cloeon dipterum TaxID=197152 RepID=A0A8S1CWA9_9INSE|nr:Hypothetical predicted protein [Cloeon dipterum]
MGCLPCAAAAENEHALRPQPYILNGADASKGQFPWQAMIRSDSVFICGGALIHARWVLTGAQCWKNTSDITLIIGSLVQEDFEEGRIEVQVSKENYFVHILYTKNPYRNDLALIKLPMALNLQRNSKNATIATIRLPKFSPSKSYVNMSAIATGWGRTDPEDTTVDSTILKFVSNNVTINEDCKNVMGIANVSSITHICTTTSNFTKGFCDRDTGGPLVVLEKDKKYTLVGISSFTLGRILIIIYLLAMESLTSELFSAETAKVTPVCRSRSLGLRRRPNTALLSAQAPVEAGQKVPLAPIENKADSDDEMRENNCSANSSLLMSSVDWDMLDAEATKKQDDNAFSSLDDEDYLAVSASMLTPGNHSIQPLDTEKLSTLERCVLLPSSGANLEFDSPESGSEDVQCKAAAVKPKKLFDEGPAEEGAERAKSPIITYKRRLPHMRSNFLQKRLKASSTPLSKVPPPSTCSTPKASTPPKKPLIETDSEHEDDSLLFELCDEIEKSVQNSRNSCVSENKVDLGASVQSLGGFTTARGTKIAISEESAKAAEAMLASFLAEPLPLSSTDFGHPRDEGASPCACVCC